MRRDERFRDDDGKLDLGKIKWHEDSSYKILLLERYIDEQQAIISRLKEENEQLKERLYEFEKRKIIEESEIDEDVIPKVKLLRTELFGEKYE